jgi:hypothetical protein
MVSISGRPTYNTGHTEPVSLQASAADHAVTYLASATTVTNLVTWTVVSFTAATFQPLVSPVTGLT